MKKKLVIITLIIVYILFIMIKHNENNHVESMVKEDDKVTIVTSFYPMYIHARALTEDVDVTLLNMADAQVGCLHDYQMTVDDMRQVEFADILIINGLGAENFQEKAYEQNPTLQMIDASHLWEASHNHEEKENENEEEGHGHEHNHENEHLWVSIEGSMQQVKAISEGLQQLDPKHAEQYKANEERYLQQLKELKQEAEEVLAGLKGKKMITVHETFEYLAEELGLEVEATIAVGEQTSLASKEIEHLVEVISAQEYPMIFTEPQYESVASVTTLAKESGAIVYELDSFVTEKTDLVGDEPEYIERMKKNIEVLKEAYKL